jgi:uncharacterized protein YndB with AHSA1/START domain
VSARVADSLHEISIESPIQSVFEAWITAEGLSSWWTRDCRIAGEKGEVNIFGFGNRSVLFHFHIDEQTAPHRVQWTGVEGPNMPAEWVGTTIDVQLIAEGSSRTRVRLSHRDWRSLDGGYRLCNTTWGELMFRLRDACEGRGTGPLFSG